MLMAFSRSLLPKLDDDPPVVILCKSTCNIVCKRGWHLPFEKDLANIQTHHQDQEARTSYDFDSADSFHLCAPLARLVPSCADTPLSAS
jgi:hypothetical protein